MILTDIKNLQALTNQDNYEDFIKTMVNFL